jgi:two-component system chemotaxis response regulator CheY
MAYNLLIVDDSATMRKIIMRGLSQSGIEFAAFTEASDGAEALAALESDVKFDLILTDVNMPNMNGLDFLEIVNDRLAENAPPVVMITTEGSDGMVKEAMRRGAKAYIKKPFTPDKIQEVIGPYLT